MPLYFFDLFDGSIEHRDDDGVDLECDADARRRSIAILEELAKGGGLAAQESRCLRVEVRDTAEVVVYRSSMTFEGGWRHRWPSRPVVPVAPETLQGVIQRQERLIEETRGLLRRRTELLSSTTSLIDMCREAMKRSRMLLGRPVRAGGSGLRHEA